MSEFLDDLLKDSDNEDLPTSIQVSQPIMIKNRHCSPDKNNHLSCLGVSKNASNTVKNVAADPFFGIRFKSGAVNVPALEILCNGIEKVSILSKVSSSAPSWVSSGVIVDKSRMLKSSNKNEYIIWKLHDLKNCEEKPRKILLFGEAAKEHWKLQRGSVVILMSPQISSDDKTTELIFKLSKASSIINIGSSVDLGTCKGKRPDGSECKALVNQSKCDMCVYHAAAEVRKLAARRGTFSQSILIPKTINTTENGRIVHQSKPKTIIVSSSLARSKEDLIISEKETLNSIVHKEATFSLGAKCLASLSSGDVDNILDKKTLGNSESFKHFLNSRETHNTKKVNERKSKEEDAVKRAIGILEEKKREERGRRNEKRGRVEYARDEEREKLVESSGRNRVLELLAKKSKHAKEADEMENQLTMNHLNSLEKREAFETAANSCTELKEVKVFSCSICKYTSKKRSEYCVKQGHTTKNHIATKRFFACKECSFKCSTYALLPTRRCQQCKSEDWERISMVQERKFILDTEKLELRGEERKFIN